MTQRYLWLLDAGHAPATQGKRSPAYPDGSRLYEWEFARDVVDRIADALARLGLAHHIVTPRTDADLAPWNRARLANAVAEFCDMPARFVSVHANAHRNEWTDAGGTATLYSGSDVSRQMAEVFQRQMTVALQLRNRGLKVRRDVSVLRRTSMPAVLTECAFYSNPEECELLRSESGRSAVARAHVNAIREIEGTEP